MSKEPATNSLELQTALDRLAVGDLSSITAYLAREMGVEAEDYILRPMSPTRPIDWKHTQYLGELDDVGPRGQFTPIDTNGLRSKIRFIDMPELFVYDKLDDSKDQFRLVRLAATGQDNVGRDLEMQTFCLKDAPQFFCMSYVWGSPDFFLPIACNGRTIKTTQNLYHGLQKCLSRYPDAWLWVDGICINQQSPEERAQQVMLMGQIFSKAALVIAHPGHYLYSKGEQPQQPPGESPVGAGGLLADSVFERATGEAQELRESSSLSDNQSSQISSSLTAANSDSKMVERHSPQVFISLMNLCSTILSSTPNYYVHSNREWTKYCLPDHRTPQGLTVWVEIVEFWRQDLFSRIWVLQEMLLAAKVVLFYEDTAISLDNLIKFLYHVDKHRMPEALATGMLGDMWTAARHLNPAGLFDNLRARLKTELEVENKSTTHDATEITLLELLVLTRTSLATDARDKIYALLGLADDEISRSVLPDYSTQNSATRLYVSLASKLAQSGKCAELLSHAGVDCKLPNLPSWVPDWTFQSRSTLRSHLYSCMGTGTTPKVSLLSSGEHVKLVIRGVRLSSVDWVGPAWRYYTRDPSMPPFAPFSNGTEVPRFSDEDAWNFIWQMAFQAAGDSCPGLYDPEELDSAVSRTLAADCSWRGQRIGPKHGQGRSEQWTDHSHKADYDEEEDDDDDYDGCTAGDEFFQGFKAFRKLYARGPESQEDLERPGVRVHKSGEFLWLMDFDREEEDNLRQQVFSFTSSLQAAQRGRRFGLLAGRKHIVEDSDSGKTEFMATLPYDSEIGDVVVLLEGFSTPFVLRECGVAGEYQLVGDCYVHGVMDGELVTKAGDAHSIPDNCIYTDAAGDKCALRVPGGYGELEDFVII